MKLSRSAEYRARVDNRRHALAHALRQLIPSQGPITLEVGCGHGHFLTGYAQAHPEKHCLGIDIVRERISRASGKRDRARLPLLHFVLAEAEEFLNALPVEASLAAIYVLFPDPWPKRRHHKNRLMQPAFLQALAERAGDQSRLYFRTDFEPYFVEVVESMRTASRWERIEEPWPFELETVFQARATNYFSFVARKPPGAPA